MIVIYDGWPLVYQPNSPAAIHLLTLLEFQPAGVQSLVILPGETIHPIPASIPILIHPTANSPRRRLVWEQRNLPELAKQHGANIIHTSAGNAALFGAPHQLVSLAEINIAGAYPAAGKQGPGAIERLRQAMAQGGLMRAAGALWPGDLPVPSLAVAPVLLPPAVHPSFQRGTDASTQSPALEQIDIPDSFVLYQGPTDSLSLHRLLDAWSWAAGSIGAYYPLVVVGLAAPALADLTALLESFPFSESVLSLPALPLPALASLYHKSSAVFHPAPLTPWSNPLRLGLAAARPVVGWEDRLSDALVGPAGYLVKAGGDRKNLSRALGAALISVIVEESLGLRLIEAARQRAARWEAPSFLRGLEQIYRQLAPTQ